jgi:hypothetical protein
MDPALAGDQNYNGAMIMRLECRPFCRLPAFLATGVKPERTVIFAFWDGEEKGCWALPISFSPFPNRPGEGLPQF